jgi:hypothetical protein
MNGTICSICKSPYEGHGNNPRPLLDVSARCCDACNSTVIIPLRMARILAFEGVSRVADFALMLARQRAKLTPPPASTQKEMALIAATGMIANAVEARYAEEGKPRAR